MDEENRRRGQLGLAMLGLTLAVAVLLSVWSVATGGSARGAAIDVGGAHPPTQVANRVEARTAGGTSAAPVGFPCTGKACDLCEQNGGTCTALPDRPGRCTCP